MINHPVVYHRNFHNDFLPQPDCGIGGKYQKIALSALPLLGIHRTFRRPLSLGMSGLRSVTHTNQMIDNFRQGNIKEGSFHLLHASLATAAIGLFFFNPVFCYSSSSISDLIVNSRNFVEHARAGEIPKTIEALAFMTLDLLFLASFCYGAIEITVACMILQIIVDFYLSAEDFKKGDNLEGMFQALLAGAHIYQLIPQLKVLQWKLNHNPVLTAELKQDKRGFVYLDVPDEYVYTLFELCGDKKAKLPPYFGKGGAGAHVSVILSREVKARNGLKIEDLGKKFTFRIVSMDTVSKGLEKVYFLTLSCSELESVRIRHGFSPNIKDHDPHLAFGIQKEEAPTISPPKFKWAQKSKVNTSQSVLV